MKYYDPSLLYCLPEGPTVSISVVYNPPDDFTPGPNEYRAASGPVVVTCTATGPGTESVSYQWSSTCRNCPFQSSTLSSITRAAVHSGDTGTHTCVATRDDGSTARASIDFNVVGGSVFCIQICMFNVLKTYIKLDLQPITKRNLSSIFLLAQMLGCMSFKALQVAVFPQMVLLFLIILEVEFACVSSVALTQCQKMLDSLLD